MFTVEIRINGTLISHIYGRNIAPLPNGKSRYEYEYYEAESRKVQTGTVEHRREDGLRSLVTEILNNVSE